MTDRMREAINNFIDKFEHLREVIEEDEEQYTAEDAIDELEEAVDALKAVIQESSPPETA